jgi:hypothetical protein
VNTNSGDHEKVLCQLCSADGPWPCPFWQLSTAKKSNEEFRIILKKCIKANVLERFKDRNNIIIIVL